MGKVFFSLKGFVFLVLFCAGSFSFAEEGLEKPMGTPGYIEWLWDEAENHLFQIEEMLRVEPLGVDELKELCWAGELYWYDGETLGERARLI